MKISASDTSSLANADVVEPSGLMGPGAREGGGALVAMVLDLVERGVVQPVHTERAGLVQSLQENIVQSIDVQLQSAISQGSRVEECVAATRFTANVGGAPPRCSVEM